MWLYQSGMSTVFVQWAHTLESAFLPNSLPPNQCITVIFVLFWNASNKTTHFQALNCLWQPNKNLYSAHKHQMCLLLRLRFGVTMSLNPKMEYQACVWASCVQCIAFKTFWHIFSIRLRRVNVNESLAYVLYCNICQTTHFRYPIQILNWINRPWQI